MCVLFYAAVQDITSATAQTDTDKAKKRPVYTTKKKKPAVTQQDTEPAPGYLDIWQATMVSYELTRDREIVTVSGSGISWAICKSASRSRQITTPALHHSVILEAGCPSCRPTNSVKALKALAVIV